MISSVDPPPENEDDRAVEEEPESVVLPGSAPLEADAGDFTEQHREVDLDEEPY
ncbi:hypothetical protein [Sciscionella sediminilitoris]|uniref:hypothetical protein n=1 Tax=Sciscionella sediminilitoris TaxID=1445613 RepID=UPI0012E1FE0D|nr:hypothetical protein [Sciscionella sp. SE31]